MNITQEYAASMSASAPLSAVDPLETRRILPEVKGHKKLVERFLWADNTKRFTYATFTYMQEDIGDDFRFS